MTLALVHRHGRHVEIEHDDCPLFRYIYRSDAIPEDEAPKPYFHPLRTLAGNDTTNFRPHDHRWHHGLAMTMPQLSGQNFWGGATYVHGRGYVALDNQGRIEHDAWLRMECDGGAAHLEHRVRWITHDGEPWLDETRSIRVIDYVPDERRYTLDMTFAMTNVSTRTLEFGSPTTEGRPNAGYGSLFWRGPRSFDGGRIMASGGLEVDAIMGQPAAWLAYQGHYDGRDDVATLVFMDRPENPRYPTKWFVRNTPYPCVSYSFMFDTVYALPPKAALTLRYGLAVIDAHWPAADVDAYAKVYAARQG